MKTILVIIILLVLALGYAGFVPGVSDVFGTNKPRDLQVEKTVEDGNRALEKLGQTIVEPADDPYQQLINAGGVAVETQLTQEELAAHLEKLHPVSDLQIVFGEDGQFEMSGRIDRERIPAFAETLGITGEDQVAVLNVVDQYLPINPVFYAKGQGSATSDSVSFSLDKAELGRVPVPVDTASDAFIEYMEFVIDRVPGFSPQTVQIENGELTFKGSAARLVPRY